MQNRTGPGSSQDFNRVREPSPAGGGPSLGDASFAGLLATLAAPQRQDTPFNDDDLAEDVATISYERALRHHTRSNPATSRACSEAGSPAVSASATNAGGNSTPLPKSLKTASITIRFSEPECTQLRRRAAEAGFTVSAYLRSCTLEVEALRAQVKQALAELRNSVPKSCDPEAKSESAGRIQTLFGALRRRFQGIGRPNAAIGLNTANPFAPVR